MAVQNFSLYAICFLDALTIGLLLPILATHVFAIGGTHTVLGILGTFYTTFQFISGPLIGSWRDVLGNKGTLLITLFISFATYIPIGLTTSYVIVVLLRLVCGLTNQTQTICKAFVAELNAQEKHDSIYSVMNVFTVAGFVVGPILGGIIYELENGFYHIALLSAVILAVCFFICLTLPRSIIPEGNKDATTFIQKINVDLSSSLRHLQNISWNKQWDAVVSKYLYNISTSVFFIKFSLLLRLHYNATSAVVGYTYAYQSSLTFLSHFVAAYFNQTFSKNLTSALLVVTLSFCGLCYASTYDIYLASFIPMILTHTLLNSLWKELFIVRSIEKHDIKGVEDTVGKIASAVAPMVLGVFCDLYGHYALKALVILPLIFNILIAVVIKPTPETSPVGKKGD